MNQERTDQESHKAFVDIITNEIRREAEGRSDEFVYHNYEDAAHLLRTASNRLDDLTSMTNGSERQDREIVRAETILWQREAEWKAWADLAEERNQAADLAEDRKLEAFNRDGDMHEAPRTPQDRQLAERSAANMAPSEQRGGFWSGLVNRLRGNQEQNPVSPPAPSAPSPARDTVSMAVPPTPPTPPVVDPELSAYIRSFREIPEPPEGFRRPSNAALDKAIEVVSVRAGIEPAEVKEVARSFSSADWNWRFSDSSRERSQGRESVEKAMEDMKEFAGKSPAHAEIASSIADNRYYDLARVGQWYVEREDRDPSLVRELMDQKLLHSFDTGRAPGDTPKGAERGDPDRAIARDFRQLSQAERLQDDRMSTGAKVVAAIDAAIERKYGEGAPEMARLKLAAREWVAQSLERGTHLTVPRVREVERQRDAGPEQARSNDRNDRDRDREDR